jgi:hypothetical protein
MPVSSTSQKWKLNSKVVLPFPIRTRAGQARCQDRATPPNPPAAQSPSPVLFSLFTFYFVLFVLTFSLFPFPFPLFTFNFIYR